MQDVDGSRIVAPLRPPQRFQRRRTKGWRKPPGSVLVTRPGRFGNPFRVKDYGQVGAVTAFRRALFSDHARALLGFTRDDVRRELAGRDLGCWCRLDQPCHADVLLEVANGPG